MSTMARAVQCFEIEGEAGADDDGVITIDVRHISNHNLLLQYATYFLRIDWIVRKEETDSVQYFYVTCPQVQAPDYKNYTLAAGQFDKDQQVAFFHTETSDLFSSCHLLNQKESELNFFIWNLLTGERWGDPWSIKASLLIPQH